MAAPKGNKNAKGNAGGKSLQDRQLAAEVRSLALTEIKAVLEGRDSQFKKALLLKLAAGILPRLTEVSGPDGEQLNVGVIILPPKNADSLATTTQTGGGPIPT